MKSYKVGLKNKIILIDDDTNSTIINSFKLKDVYPDFKVLVYSSALDFIEVLKNADFSVEEVDYMLLDLNMPLMNGWDFLEYMKRENLLEIRVIVLTSSINQSDRNKSNEYSNVIGFIPKPFTISKLEDLLQA